jgi:general stress protein 26
MASQMQPQCAAAARGLPWVSGASSTSKVISTMTSEPTHTDICHDQQPDSADQREHLWSLIKDIRFAMFTYSASDGDLHARPMTTQNKAIDEDASLWFFMSRRSEPVISMAGQPVVNVAYADTDGDRYVSVSGTAAVVNDAAKAGELWSKMAEAWFPGGVDDPDLALVQVQIRHASYWDVKSNKLVQLFKMAKASVTGKAPTDLGEHGDVRMR